METLNKIMEAMTNALNAPVLMSIAIGMEFMFRMIKTEKPLSIAYIVADGIKKVGEICMKIGQIMDKVLPQRIK